MSTATLGQTDSDLRSHLDSVINGRTFITVLEYGRLIGVSRKAIQQRAVRGTLPFPTHRVGGQTSARVVAAADVYASFGLAAPSRPSSAMKPTTAIEFYPDGSLRLIG